VTVVEDTREAEHSWFHALLSDLDPPTLEEFLERPEWMKRAECRGTDTAVFFPERGDSLEPARAICERCEVRPECLEYALSLADGAGLTKGVWGGTSDRERARIRLRRASA
jgi:WhiB family redox-sensing transcriptional regulator